MANNVQFTDNSIKVKKAIKSKCLQCLAEVSQLLLTQVQRNTKVKTGQLKNSWKFEINDDKLESRIGSPLENSIWEEFGTGEYALNGDGRKTAWSYKDKTTGKWYKTTGKKPKRALFNAFNSLKQTIISKIENTLKEIN